MSRVFYFILFYFTLTFILFYYLLLFYFILFYFILCWVQGPPKPILIHSGPNQGPTVGPQTSQHGPLRTTPSRDTRQTPRHTHVMATCMALSPQRSASPSPFTPNQANTAPLHVPSNSHSPMRGQPVTSSVSNKLSLLQEAQLLHSLTIPFANKLHQHLHVLSHPLATSLLGQTTPITACYLQQP